VVHSAAYSVGHTFGTIFFFVGVLAIGVYFGNRLGKKRNDGIFVRWPVGAALAVDLLALLGQCSGPTQAAALLPSSASAARILEDVHSPPKDSIATIFSSGDYPPEAFKNGWEGDVGIKVRVGVDGKPQSCRILHSSGYPVLDVQTCAIVLGRARFLPARDARGEAVEDDFVLPTVRWAIDGSTGPHLASDLTPSEANWQLVGHGSAGRAYLDFNSLGRQGNYRVAWVKNVFAQAMSNGTGYAVGQYRYDCAKKTSTLLRGGEFREDGAPLLIVQFPEAAQKTLPVTPNSAMEAVFNRVCT
jgi:TonB family protein